MSNERWIPITERLPAEDETLDGRVPAIDEDGFLITAVLSAESLIGTGSVAIAYWTPPPRRDASPADGEVYITTPGESVAGIALRQLRNERRWTELRDLNAARFPEMMASDYYPVGTRLKMPATN